MCVYLRVHAVLDSEVQDLRVCLKSADKELKELKDEMREEKSSHDNKATTYVLKVRTCMA